MTTTISAGVPMFTIAGVDGALTAEQVASVRGVLEQFGQVTVTEVPASITLTVSLELSGEQATALDALCAELGVDKTTASHEAIAFLLNSHGKRKKRTASPAGEGSPSDDSFKVSALTNEETNAACTAGVISAEVRDGILAGKFRVGPVNARALREWMEAGKSATPSAE